MKPVNGLTNRSTLSFTTEALPVAPEASGDDVTVVGADVQGSSHNQVKSNCITGPKAGQRH